VSELVTPTPVVEFLNVQPGWFRTYSTHGLVSLAEAVIYDLEMVDGNDPFQFSYYVQWIDAATGCDLDAYSVSVPTCSGNEVDAQAYLRAQPSGKLLGIGGVRYVIADHAPNQWSSSVWRLGSVRVYENTEVLPRAFTVPTVIAEDGDATALALLQANDPTEMATVSSGPDSFSPGALYHPAQVVRQGPNRIEVRANGPGWLVLSEIWAPGWRASLDGVPVKVYRTDVTFCGLPLSDGHHVVKLVYAPRGWTGGRFVSLGTVVVTAVITVGILWNRYRTTTMKTAQK
jgi:hypothetical protein